MQPGLRILRMGLLPMMVVGMILGCGSSIEQPQSRESASLAFQTGVDALAAKDFQKAVDQLSLALDGGWLGYTTSSALAQRAIANAALGNFEAAHADLDTAEQGEGNASELYAARSYVFEKEGKRREATVAWNQAKKLNRRVKKIDY